MTQMITYKTHGNFRKTFEFLERMKHPRYLRKLNEFGDLGVSALRSRTPVESGETASKWYYEIEEEDGRTTIYFNNSHVENGCNIAVILNYGHGTRTGGWVQGRNYIDPVIQPIFDEIAQKAWKEITRK